MPHRREENAPMVSTIERPTAEQPVTKPPAAPRLAPGPKGHPVIGNLVDLRRGSMIEFYRQMWEQYGDIVRLQMGPLVSHLLVEPEYVKYVLSDNKQNYEKGLGFKKLQMTLGSGLFTAEGDLWRRQRSVMQPTFTPKGVSRFAPDMVELTERMLNGWEVRRLKTGAPLNVNTAMMRLAMNIIARTMFGIDIGRDAMQAAGAFTYVLETVSRKSLNIVDVPLWVPTKSNRRFNRAIQVLDDFIYGIIDSRRANPSEERDLLGVLLAAADPETGEPMSRRQLRDEVITIFFAGHETTAQAMTWTWYLLAQHPDIERRLQEEAESVLGGRMPTYADIEKLTYAEMVVKEAMRLYPPVWVFVRDSLDEDEIGSYHIPKGSMMTFSQYLTHRHPKYWDDPEKFDPERFTPEGEKSRPKYAYFPFGGGPRICIGNNFAMLEAVTAVAMTARRYSIKLVPGQDIRPKMVGTLRPSAPVMVTLEPRRG
jgi:cytochrome P450